MTSKTNSSSRRLLKKIARYIGRSTFKYISRVLEHTTLSSVEIEILERVFTMGFYSDETIDNACFTALDQDVYNIVDFTFLISEVDNTTR